MQVYRLQGPWQIEQLDSQARLFLQLLSRYLEQARTVETPSGLEPVAQFTKDQCSLQESWDGPENGSTVPFIDHVRLWLESATERELVEQDHIFDVFVNRIEHPSLCNTMQQDPAPTRNQAAGQLESDVAASSAPIELCRATRRILRLFYLAGQPGGRFDSDEVSEQSHALVRQVSLVLTALDSLCDSKSESPASPSYLDMQHALVLLMGLVGIVLDASVEFALVRVREEATSLLVTEILPASLSIASTVETLTDGLIPNLLRQLMERLLLRSPYHGATFTIHTVWSVTCALQTHGQSRDADILSLAGYPQSVPEPLQDDANEEDSGGSASKIRLEDSKRRMEPPPGLLLDIIGTGLDLCRIRLSRDTYIADQSAAQLEQIEQMLDSRLHNLHQPLDMRSRGTQSATLEDYVEECKALVDMEDRLVTALESCLMVRGVWDDDPGDDEDSYPVNDVEWLSQS